MKKQIFLLVARIILMVITGTKAITATINISNESGIAANKLWQLLPEKYKRM